MKKRFLTVVAIALLLSGCVSFKKSNKITLNYIEYARGKSFPNRADLSIQYGDNDYTLNNLHLDDQSFFEDNSIIPNAFLKPLFKLKVTDAVKALTEPYYSYRLIHFFKANPHFGLGVEFIHLKVFMMDLDQKVRMTGKFRGETVDKSVRAGDILDLFNISHGVNHAGIHFVYRWLFSPSIRVPEGRFQPYFDISAGPTIPHLELNTVEIDGVKKRAYSYQSRLWNWGFGLGTGIRYKPWAGLGFYFEYKLTYSYLRGMYFDDMSDTSVKANFLTHQLLWGLSFMF